MDPRLHAIIVRGRSPVRKGSITMGTGGVIHGWSFNNIPAPLEVGVTQTGGRFDADFVLTPPPS